MCSPGSRATLALLLFAVAAGCGRTKDGSALAPAEVLDGVLGPSALAVALRQAGGGHFHATAMFRVDLAKPEAGNGKPAAPPVVTTTTDLWMDKAGNYRLAETNDQDGGRDIARVGGEIAVALRHGKTVRRRAQDAEGNRYLAEALGAPWAAWELVRRQVAVEGGPAWRFKLGERRAAPPLGFAATEGLRKWRDGVLVKAIDGQTTLDATGKLPVAFTCKASFQGTRDGVPIAGEVAVTAALDQIGKVADVVLPEVEPVPLRQRTVLEERALLGGLGAGAAPAAPLDKAVP